ncbi:hypothetical protein NUTIK01_04340 [Novosphingobium sp. IK01]|uniref:Uncharacterized protein n=1 Tax=Novosphingobium pituita TaxID=3056842 RepID=A0ABQ6P327_9SPHN|nr:hypothetical protein NUTIK01_04340 [Novosphingobium sp. IK01]
MERAAHGDHLVEVLALGPELEFTGRIAGIGAGLEIGDDHHLDRDGLDHRKRGNSRFSRLHAGPRRRHHKRQSGAKRGTSLQSMTNGPGFPARADYDGASQIVFPE